MSSIAQEGGPRRTPRPIRDLNDHDAFLDLKLRSPDASSERGLREAAAASLTWHHLDNGWHLWSCERANWKVKPAAARP